MNQRFAFFRDLLLLLVWLAVIFSWSTSLGSASHTNSWVDDLLGSLFPRWYAHLPWSAQDVIHYSLRKTAHLTEYAVFGLLAVRVLHHGHWPRRAVLISAWVAATLYAATDETHQIFVAGRTPKVTDVLLDSAGAAIGIGLTALWSMRRVRHSMQD